MKKLLTQIRWACPACNCRLIAEPEEAGDRFKCPRCPEIMIIPGTPAKTTTASSTTVAADGTVPIEVSLPGIGSVGGRVTKESSGNIISAVVGGFLVVLGVMVCTMLGVKPPART